MPDRPLFAVVIPTIGRPTLPRTLESIRGQTQYSNAEILVVVDTHGADMERVFEVKRMANAYGALVSALDAGQHDIGSPQLHLGFMRATGSYVLNFGDDDVYESNAFEAIATAIADQDVMHPLMFKVELHPNDQRGNREPVTLWERPEIDRFNVTGQSFVCPSDHRYLGRWVDDVTFMRETVAMYGGQIDWREELIAKCY